jgi:hypothetical protein
MAEVKVPAKLHLMSKAAQKAWYKKNNMAMPDDAGGRSAAAAKKVKVAPRKEIAVEPGSVRALNAARQQAYLAKGGRQPIGAMGSGGSNVMAGGGQSTIKDLKASIKAGFNPKVSLDPYESEKAKKVGPRSLKMKKEEVQIDEALSPERKRMFDLKLKLIKKVANKKSYTKPSKVDEPRSSLNPSRDMKLTPKSMPTVAVGHYKEEIQIDEVTGYEGVKDRTDIIKRAAAMGRMGKNVFLARVKARAAEMKKEKKAMKEEVKDQADVGEYDYEGDMAKSQLRSILANAKRMHDMLEDTTNLPEWVQSKITLAEDYILTAANYMEGEMNEELIRQEESIFEAMKKMEMDDEEDEMDDEDDEDEMEDDDEEDDEEDDEKKMNEKYMGFKAVMAAAKKGGARDPAAVAAAIGRKKYGKEKFQAAAAAGKKMGEEVEVVAEAEGKVAVTPKEKDLAAHHGDKTRITYGDVIKARLKSVAAKAMNKGK